MQQIARLLIYRILVCLIHIVELGKINKVPREARQPSGFKHTPIPRVGICQIMISGFF
jgi:hypothetical protein